MNTEAMTVNVDECLIVSREGQRRPLTLMGMQPTFTLHLASTLSRMSLPGATVWDSGEHQSVPTQLSKPSAQLVSQLGATMSRADSPLLSYKSETEWVLERLETTLERQLLAMRRFGDGQGRRTETSACQFE